ncbi:Metalloprotease, insulinase family [Giardia duodenalis]|uniref:Metalloprotease, insulinase family n=1 Tax=Giardia intestinalis (strain ATCC 50803 / WB clone C6) TaxID=184922 RepID=A8BTG2_GIAIC|nr:Metalloprotease, insulinase family [Giardia intestinalis]KAE8304424.1 Metalloprotease, insulinase family [Giardia intestinalis]|eukprot:XP_001704875.1 Metalloprotease, insulinase family [Giardia lamblia ATCC 50803]
MPPPIGSVISGFTVVRTVEQIPEIDCSLIELEHKLTGFRAIKLTPLQASYPEFSASIGFCTPPTSDTGLPHILSRSVLCGSDRYPLPDPFGQLLQGSLKTYLNAGTYDTFTLYPFASRCEKDYLNIMAIYLDAVFCPALLHDKRVFHQEAWSMHLMSNTSELELRGAILNELTVAFSEPIHIAVHALKQALFDGGSLMYTSIGHPDHIVTLEPDDLVEYHSTHYTMANGRIAYHSTLPLEKELSLIYDRYLQPLESMSSEELAPYIVKKAPILAGALPINACIEPLRLSYPIAKESQVGFRQGYLVRMWRTFNINEVTRTERLALDTLSGILFGATSSPVLAHLQKLGLISELSVETDDTNCQGYTYICLHGCEYDEDSTSRLRRELDRVFLLLENENSTRTEQDPLSDYMFYLSPTRISSEMDRLEFELREHQTNYGVKVLTSLFGSWFYNVTPEEELLFEGAFLELREKIAEGTISVYMRELLRRYYIDNKAWKDAILTPTPGLAEDIAEAKQRELQDKKSMMSEKEINGLVAQTLAVLNRSNEVDEKVLREFPQVSEADLVSLEDDYLQLRIFSRSLSKHNSPGVHLNDVPINVYNTGSLGNGIVHFSMFIDVSELVTFEEAPLISFLAGAMLGNVSTENYESPEQLQLAISNVLGKFRVSMEYRYSTVHTLNASETYPRAYIRIDASFLESKTDQALHLILSEIWQKSMVGLGNLELVFKILHSHKEQMESHFLQKMGYYIAYTRAMALSGSIGAIYDEYVNGINYLEYLKKTLLEPPADSEISSANGLDFDEECIKHNVYTLTDDDLKIAIVMSRKLKNMYARLLQRHTSIAVCIGLNVPELEPFMNKRIITSNTQAVVDKIINGLLIVQKLQAIIHDKYSTHTYDINKWNMKPDIFPITEHAAHFLTTPVKLHKKDLCPPEKDSQRFLKMEQDIQHRMLSVAAPVNVNYVARSGRLPLTELTGAELLLLHIITYDYLAKKIRIENGACGCFFILSRSRWSYLTTYLDPQLVETKKVFDEIKEYIDRLTLTAEELLFFKIGAVGKRQMDLAPLVRFTQAVDYWLEGNSVNDYRRAVGQIRRMTINDLKSAAVSFEAVISGQTVVFGKADDVRQAAEEGIILGCQEYKI